MMGTLELLKNEIAEMLRDSGWHKVDEAGVRRQLREIAASYGYDVTGSIHQEKTQWTVVLVPMKRITLDFS